MKMKIALGVYFVAFTVILASYWRDADPPSVYVVALLAVAAVLVAVVLMIRQHPTRRM
jgi:hypothetical protein